MRWPAEPVVRLPRLMATPFARIRCRTCKTACSAGPGFLRCAESCEFPLSSRSRPVDMRGTRSGLPVEGLALHLLVEDDLELAGRRLVTLRVLEMEDVVPFAHGP